MCIYSIPHYRPFFFFLLLSSPPPLLRLFLALPSPSLILPSLVLTSPTIR